MVLSFKTEINGKETNFVEKIWQSLPQDDELIQEWFMDGKIYERYDFSPDAVAFPPKIHTIREDKADRWHPGVMIDFFINARQVDMFRFAPRFPVVSTQEIFMTHRGSMLEITIAAPGSSIGGDDFYFDGNDILGLNDGFDEYGDFNRYFIGRIQENGKTTGNYWFKGKIIHWTNFRYEKNRNWNPEAGGA